MSSAKNDNSINRHFITDKASKTYSKFLPKEQKVYLSKILLK